MRLEATALVAVSVLAVGTLAPTTSVAGRGTQSGNDRAGVTGHISQAKQIQVGSSPTGIARAGSEIYVAVQGADKVAVIDVHSNKVVRRFKHMREPGDVIASPDGDMVYVSVSSGPFGIKSINTRTGKVRKIKSDGGTLLLSPSGKYLYASPGGAAIQRVNLNNGHRRRVPGSEGFAAGEISPKGKYLYASTPGLQPDMTAHPRLMKINAKSGRILRSVPISEDTLWMFPGDLLMGPKRKWLYVSKQGINNGWTGVSGHTVQRYRASDLSEGREYEVGVGDTNVELGPQGMAFAERQRGTRLAVANSNTGRVAIVNLRTKSTKTRATAFAPTAVAFKGNGRKLYVSNTGFGGIYPKTVSVLHLSA